MNKVVFLDRDGTINIDSGYVRRVEDVILLPRAAQAIGDIKRAGYSIVVVTNQSAIGRGMCTHERVRECNERLRELLLEEDRDATLDHVLYCPAHPDEGAECRKPNTGMLKMLPKDFNVDFGASWMLGDRKSDIDFGTNSGIPAEHCLLVRTGGGEKTEQEHFRGSAIVFDDLFSASRRILGQS
jgi:D-glycero-D-manno-heptose 1,7-bisphosphate phosphatase